MTKRHDDDEYDDDIDIDTDDDDTDLDDDTDDIVPSGSSVRVSIDMMDATQRSIHDDVAAHKPGWRVPESIRDQDHVVAKAHREYVRYLTDAHRSHADATPRPKRRQASLADARAAAEQAYEERSQWLRDAHRGGR